MLKSLLGTAALMLATAATAQMTNPPSEPAPMEAPVAPAPAADPAPAMAPAAEPAPAMAATPAALPRCSATVRDSCVQNERYASRKSTPGMRDNNALHNKGKRTRG